MTDTNLVEIFCILDEFCKYFAPELKRHTIQTEGKRHRNRPSRMSDSEIMTILVLSHTHRFRDLKSFCHGYICQHMRADFPNIISYNRYVDSFVTSLVSGLIAYNLLPQKPSMNIENIDKNRMIA